MSKKALEDEKFELIKAHVLDPDHSPLPEHQKKQLSRLMSMARVLDKQPIQKNAVAIHLRKYSDINRTQAYEDCRLAMRLFNTLHTFDYDFWHAWLLNDIVRNIERARKNGEPRALRVIALEHSNLIKALGDRPPQDLDPKLVEKNTFIIPISIDNRTFNIELEKLLNLPSGTRKKVADALFSEIDIDEAEEIIDS